MCWGVYCRIAIIRYPVLTILFLSNLNGVGEPVFSPLAISHNSLLSRTRQAKYVSKAQMGEIGLPIHLLVLVLSSCVIKRNDPSKFSPKSWSFPPAKTGTTVTAKARKRNKPRINFNRYSTAICLVYLLNREIPTRSTNNASTQSSPATVHPDASLSKALLDISTRQP